MAKKKAKKVPEEKPKMAEPSVVLKAIETIPTRGSIKVGDMVQVNNPVDYYGAKLELNAGIYEVTKVIANKITIKGDKGKETDIDITNLYKCEEA